MYTQQRERKKKDIEEIDKCIEDGGYMDGCIEIYSRYYLLAWFEGSYRIRGFPR